MLHASKLRGQVPDVFDLRDRSKGCVQNISWRGICYTYWAIAIECFWITPYWHWTDNRVFHKETLLASMDQLNSLPNTTANFSLQVFSILPHRPSGPVTVGALTLLNTSVTLSSSFFVQTHLRLKQICLNLFWPKRFQSLSLFIKTSV